MPASSSELVAVSLQNSSERESKGCCGSFNVKSQDQELNVLSKQILIQDFDCENWWQSSSHTQSTVRRVCCPINKKENHQIVTNNKFLKKDKSKMAYSKAEDKLEEPRVTLWSPDKVVLGWRKTFPPGAGMVNLGNSCYMNSSLQALFHIPSLANWLLEEINTHIPSCESNPQNYSFCSICTMMRTIKQSLDHGTTVFKPLLLHNKLKCICKTFGYGRQEDAHEFIKLLIDHMEKSFLQHKRAVKLDHRSKETTPLNQIFGGYLRQQVICPLCCYVSTTFSHFQDLVLDIRSVNSVDEALNLYFKKETLDSDNAYKCEKCHKKVPATKRHLIERAPHVLLLQLKRFTISGGKITKHVNIQKNIDISRYVNGVKPLHPNGTGSYFYRLVSMVIHIGSSQHGGHYTAVAEASNNTMFEFDDSSVRPISVQSALLKNPYILFYEMVRKPKSNSVPKQVIRQSSEKALIRQSSNDKISKPLPTSLSTSCMWNGTNSHATAEDIGEAVVHNGISNSKKSPLLPQKEREKISFGIKSHSGFSKGQEENKYSKPNGLILKRPFQLNSSSLTKSHTNGRNYVSSGLVPYNDESESSDDNESTDNRDAKDSSCKFVNGHSNGHEKFVNKSGKSTDSSENSRSNNNGDKGNDSLKSKNHVEKMSNIDKIKKDKMKEDTTCISSQGISGLNNKSTSFLPRSVQILSSGNGKNVGGNKVNNSMPKILNGHSSTDNINEKKNSEHEKIDNISLKEEHNDSYGTNSGNRTKKENGYICSSSSNGLSPVEVRTPNSSPSQSLTDRSKTKSKPEKVLKERDSFSGWISCNNTHKTELEKSFSHDSVLNSKVQQNDKSETASLKSKESLDSNRSDKSSKSVKKSIFSLFPCVSSTQSPDFSPEDEQINSVIENKSSPVRTDPKRLPDNKSISQNYPQKPEVASYSKEKNISRLKEEEEDEETEDDNDDDDYDEEEDDNFHVQKVNVNSSGKCSAASGGSYSLTSNGSLDSPLVKENISERLENGENYEEKSSKSKHQKGPQTAKVINAENHGCEEDKKERNFSIKDEENFSMEEKKSRHKKKHKMKPNGAIKCDGSIPSYNGVSSNSSNNTDSNIIIYNWNRNVKDLSDDLPSNKKNETVFSNNFIKNVSWNGSDDLSVVNALKRAGELPFGHEVKTWEGEESVFDKEIRKERNQAKKRSADDMYNDDYDRGKVRKKRFKSFHFDSTERRENLFQKFQNEYLNNNHKINSNFNSKNSSDENTFHTNNFRSNSYNSTTTTNSNGNSTSSINNHSKTNGSHIYGFNDRNYNGIGSNNKNNSNSNINGNLSRNMPWDTRNSPFPSQQNHFRPGLYNYSRSKPHHWYKNYRNGKGKFGKKRDFRNSRH